MVEERSVEVDMVAEHGRALADAIDGAIEAWVERSVTRTALAAGMRVDEHLVAAARVGGRAARADIGARVKALLARDMDDQGSNPLAIVRGGVRYPTEVLFAAGVPAPERDEMQARLLPDDPYDLAPASFADIDPALAELGIAWGAAKAYEHLRRRPRAAPEPELKESTW